MGTLDRDLQASVGNLSDGFAALSAEYKLLAATHQDLEGKLQSTQQEAQALRQLLSEKDKDKVAAIPRANTAPKSIPSRSLSEWVEQSLKSGSTVTNTSLSRIKDAELACFKLQTHLKNKRPSFATHRSRPGNANRVPINPVMDIEQDFTIPGSPGKLDCPYASMTKHNRPTPKGSESQCAQRDSHLKVDDGQPDKLSVVGSTNASGPCCPIRFLDQKSPEEIAKYFEEHKHELPRSHEVCVKRFQANAESIKELDKKYGNLVNMVKGLGQKHQPMLPVNPASGSPDEIPADTDTEERHSAIKVTKWANTVSDSLRQNAQSGEDPDQMKAAEKEGGEDEERVPHFDRPMKEIRVGESPSRPWGVPIPSKYLDRADDYDDGEVAQVPSESPVPVEVEPLKSNMKPMAENKTAPGGSWLESLDQQRKTSGKKCPVDHETLMKMKRVGLADQAAMEPQEVKVKPTHPRPAKAQAVENIQAESNAIVNNGTTIAASSSSLQGLHFINNGALLLGYHFEQARTFLEKDRS